MNRFFRLLNVLFVVFGTGLCFGQTNGTQTVGGPFENREYIYSGIPKVPSAVDTSPGWKFSGQKLLITGTVYQNDGVTPAPGVIVYYYQTNTEGRYLHRPEESRSMVPNAQGQTHGFIRGWAKSGMDGRYSIYTIRPGKYPSRDFPAHIHLTVKEPNTINEYYIDDIVFDDDRLLTTAERLKAENRAGSGIVRLVQRDGLHIGERNIILGMNIPNYPAAPKSGPRSGKSIGENIISFTPYHVWGPDKGTKTCPVCKYGWHEGILYFVGNNPDWNSVRKWLTFLESESATRQKYLKVYFIYGNTEGYSHGARQQELEKIGKELNIRHTALTYVPSFADEETKVHLNKVDPSVKNTFMIFRRSMVVGNYVNFAPTADNFREINQRLERTRTEYFDLPGARQE
ncbi:MAG: intradiol ring-cleavage dioxygenase [Bacteroidetes bacterium]|nr:intradiol ring-cleavage dioxygenase [Bacteroidota bacterium]